MYAGNKYSLVIAVWSGQGDGGYGGNSAALHSDPAPDISP